MRAPNQRLDGGNGFGASAWDRSADRVAVESCGADLLPPEILAGLREILCDNTVKHLALSAEMLRVLRLFGLDGIRRSLSKVPSPGRDSVEDIAWRPISDINLLVHPADITRAKGVLADADTASARIWPWTQETVAMHWNSQTALAPAARLVSVRGLVRLDLGSVAAGHLRDRSNLSTRRRRFCSFICVLTAPSIPGKV